MSRYARYSMRCASRCRAMRMLRGAVQRVRGLRLMFDVIDAT